MTKYFRYLIYNAIKSGKINYFILYLYFSFNLIFYKNKHFHLYVAYKNNQPKIFKYLLKILILSESHYYKLLIYMARKNDSESFWLVLDSIKNLKTKKNSINYFEYNDIFKFLAMNNNIKDLTKLFDLNYINFEENFFKSMYEENTVKKIEASTLFFILDKFKNKKTKLEIPSRIISKFIEEEVEEEDLIKFYDYCKINKLETNTLYNFDIVELVNQKKYKIFLKVYNDIKNYLEDFHVYLILVKLIEYEKIDLFKMVFKDLHRITDKDLKDRVFYHFEKTQDEDLLQFISMDKYIRNKIKEELPNLYKDKIIKEKILDF